MTAFELRRHLAAEHGVRMVGADYGTRSGADHTHDPDGEGDG